MKTIAETNVHRIVAAARKPGAQYVADRKQVSGQGVTQTHHTLAVASFRTILTYVSDPSGEWIELRDTHSGALRRLCTSTADASRRSVGSDRSLDGNWLK